MNWDADGKNGWLDVEEWEGNREFLMLWLELSERKMKPLDVNEETSSHCDLQCVIRDCCCESFHCRRPMLAFANQIDWIMVNSNHWWTGDENRLPFSPLCWSNICSRWIFTFPFLWFKIELQWISFSIYTFNSITNSLILRFKYICDKWQCVWQKKPNKKTPAWNSISEQLLHTAIIDFDWFF